MRFNFTRMVKLVSLEFRGPLKPRSPKTRPFCVEAALRPTLTEGSSVRHKRNYGVDRLLGYFSTTKSQTSRKRMTFFLLVLKVREMYNLDFGLQGKS